MANQLSRSCAMASSQVRLPVASWCIGLMHLGGPLRRPTALRRPDIGLVLLPRAARPGPGFEFP